MSLDHIQAELDDEWDYVYGTIVKDGEYVMTMAGGGSHWWEYSITEAGVFINNKDGHNPIKGKLVSGGIDDAYLCVKNNEYVLKEDETDIYEYLKSTRLLKKGMKKLFN